MKVFTKILGAVLLLGCLAYISFVFGKYVLSSTLLKSIPQSERIINTDNPTHVSAPDTPPDQKSFSPKVEMRVMPSTRPARKHSLNTNKKRMAENDDEENDSSTDNADSDDADTTRKKPKKFDEGEVSSSRRRRSRQSKKSEKTDEAEKVIAEKDTASKPAKKKTSSSSSAPVRRMNEADKTAESSPIPKPEKSTSVPSGSGDAASISPVPKPE